MDKLKGHWDHSTKPSKFCVKRGGKEIYRGGYSDGYELIMSNNTPETNDLARGNHVVPTDWAEQLERERDEARSTLTDIYRWIEQNHPDGFIDSLTFSQNLERVGDRWYDRLDIVERERDEERKIAEKLRKERFEARKLALALHEDQTSWKDAAARARK
jgi:hypothetical protein